MANGGNKIGDAYVEISARMERLEADLAQAKAKLAAFASASTKGMNEAGDAAEKYSRRATSSYGRALASFTAMVSRVTAAIGVFALFARVGREVGEAMETGAEKAEAFISTVDFTNPDAAFESLSKRCAELEARIDAARNSWMGFAANLLFDKDTVGRMNDQLEVLSKSLSAVAKQRAAIRARESDRKSEQEMLKIAQARKQVEDGIARARESFHDRIFGRGFDISQLEKAVRTMSQAGRLYN